MTRAGLRTLIGLAPWALALAGVLALAGGLGVRWDPFGLAARRLDRAEARAIAAETEVERLNAALEADRALAAVRERAVERVTVARASVDDLTRRAEGAPDARTPLDPDRLARLREHDRRLCGIAPHLVGCAGDAEPAAGGGDAVSPGGPAG
ncbi:hypothetical protein [Brevundimonas balnearis]|uniref:Uncharacterized protein n=1 Tax=Brevundimonas balnearis TaxID=1572858 RepID=A0ABV6R580_9CAUL